MPSGKIKNKRDRYIGKIVELSHLEWFSYNISNSNYVYWYDKHDLFLVVGIKYKTFNRTKNCHYILKPLSCDQQNENPDKQLVWHKYFYVGCECFDFIIKKD